MRQYPDVARHYLLMGCGGIYTRPTLVQTVLGSCVSVCFFCRTGGFGAVFHAVLPEAAKFGYKTDPDQDYKFVDESIAILFERLRRRGVRRRDLECKVFGGANFLFSREMGVGKRNVQAAYESLARLRLRVCASNVGGDRGRKILFASHTGEVYLKFLNEKESLERLKRQGKCSV